MSKSYLVGKIKNGVIIDAQFSSEFPMTTLIKDSSIQVVLLEAEGKDYENANFSLIARITINQGNHDWSWLRKMPTLSAQLLNCTKRATEQHHRTFKR